MITPLLVKKFLFQKCSVEKGGEYAVTGGHVSAGNTSREQAAIEIKEELGLDVVKAKYMSSKYHQKKEILLLNFIVIVEDKAIKLKEDEIAEARWCTPEEALSLIRKGTTAEYFLTNAVRELKKKI